MLKHIEQPPCIRFLHLMLHRVPRQVAWDLRGCGSLLQILLAENPLLYLLILLHKVEYRVLWVDIALQDSIEAFTPCCCLEEGEETMHEIRRDPTMSHVVQMLEPLIISHGIRHHQRRR